MASSLLAITQLLLPFKIKMNLIKLQVKDVVER